MDPDPGRYLAGDRIHPQQPSGAFDPQTARPEGNAGERRAGVRQDPDGPIGARVDTHHGITGGHPRRAAPGGNTENSRKPEGRREHGTRRPMMCAPSARRVPHPPIVTARTAATTTAPATPLRQVESGHVPGPGDRIRAARIRVMYVLFIGRHPEPAGWIPTRRFASRYSTPAGTVASPVRGVRR